MIRILLAEDFELLREDLSELIQRQADMTLLGSAGSGARMIQLAREIEADIILMDIEMESANAGILAAETIRDLGLPHKIIYLTAHENERTVLAAMASGAVDYIVKGSPEEEILRHIRAAYDGQPLLDAKIQNVVLHEYHRLRQSERSLLYFINNISQLTPAERELVALLLQDKKVREIAAIRCVEQVTVKTQIKTLLRKFNCGRSRQIVDIIKELGLTQLFLNQADSK